MFPEKLSICFSAFAGLLVRIDDFWGVIEQEDISELQDKNLYTYCACCKSLIILKELRKYGILFL